MSAVRLRRPARTVFAVALAAYLAVAAWLVWRTSILEPYSDMFDWIDRWRRLQADGDIGRYLWAPHNFHHLVWTFAVLDLDIRAFGGSSYLFLAVGVLCLAAIAVMLARIAAAAAGPGLRLVGAGGAVALSAMGCDILDVSADINTTYVQALVFAMAAILLAEGPAARRPAGRIAALACAVAAGLGSAAGLAVWPALLFTAARGRRLRWALIVAATGGVYGLVYLLGQAGPAGAGGNAGRLADAVALFVNYLGLPWVRAIPAAGWALGLAVLAPSLIVVTVKGGPEASWPERAAVALVVFSLATAVMAAAARTGLIAPTLVPMRYSVFLIPLHVGLWIVALPYLRRVAERWPSAVAPGLVGFAALILVHQAVMALYAVRTADINLRMIADFRSGQRTPAMLITIYADLAQAQALSEAMARDGLYRRELRPDPPAALSGSGISASAPGP